MLDKNDVANMVLNNKFHLGMKHDVIAWFDPSRGMLKESKTGSKKLPSGVYSKEPFLKRNVDGFVGACNIVYRAWNNCKMISCFSDDKSAILNSRGNKINKDCARRYNATALGNLFNYYFKRFFNNEINNFIKEKTERMKDEIKSTE